MIMIFIGLIGLIFGSFITALVWRLHEQEEQPKKSRNKHNLSIIAGRSMCPSCGHKLSALDLVPLFSWLLSRGRCRYCSTKISIEYPLIELSTAILFIISYNFWPNLNDLHDWVTFITWLAILVCLIALAVYDLKWYLLPNRIVYPLTGLATAFAVLNLDNSADQIKSIIYLLISMFISGGIFYILFQLSKGKWIGGGDVKLGWAIGLIVGAPSKAFLMLFLASLLGTLVALPLMYIGKVGKKSVIPFGPFLIASTIIVVLFGADILSWYQSTFINL